MVRLATRVVAIGAVLLTLGGAKVWAEFDEGMAAYKRGDYQTALREWRQLAERGHVVAQYNLGVLYQKGDGIPQDYAEAAKWYKKAADQGDAKAQSALDFLSRKARTPNEKLRQPMDFKSYFLIVIFALLGLFFVLFLFLGNPCPRCGMIFALNKTGAVKEGENFQGDFIEYRCKYCGHQYSEEQKEYW